MSAPQPFDNPVGDFAQTTRAFADRAHALFRQGLNTFEIANLCRVEESAVYNALFWRVERERQIAAVKRYEARLAGE